MTFSIVARSDDGLLHGVAVASKFLGVGAAVPAAEATVGALATQSYANLAYRPQGLAMLRTGTSAAGTIAALTAADPEREHRQLGVVGREGDGASFTGANCHGWAGGHTGPGYAIQGNILTGPDVVDAMRSAWLGTDDDFAHRLLAALAAGDRSGGDSRGRQSAAILVVGAGTGYGGTSDVAMDLRVDDHRDPVPELTRLADAHRLYFGKPDPALVLAFDDGLSAEVGRLLARLGHSGEVEPALHSWAGIANLEERMVPGGIDPLVLAELRREAGGIGSTPSELQIPMGGISHADRRMRSARTVATIELTEQTFTSTIEADGIVLVDYWAEWCGPCKRFGPVFEAASEKHPDVVFGKVDTEAEQGIAQAANITSIPTLMAFRDGILVFAQPGALPASALDDVIGQVRELDMDEVRAKVEAESDN